LQINFNEGVDPTVTQGRLSATSTYEYVIVNSQGQVIPGTWKITNGYKTLEFVSDEPCGLNSCGEMMYCLPVDCTGDIDECTKGFEALVRTAQATGNTQAPFEAMPFSGVYDLAFNGLDSAEDGLGEDDTNGLTKPNPYTGKIIQAGENAPDNYYWSFNVQNKIDRSAPFVAKILPAVDAQDVVEDAPLEITFSKPMWISTVRDMSLTEYPEHVCADAGTTGDNTCEDNERLRDVWYVVYARAFEEYTEAFFRHREFGPNGVDLYYFPDVPSTVKSVNQNCIYPGLGPWDDEPAFFGDSTSQCSATYTDNGDTVMAPDCVGVNTESPTDSGCVFTGAVVSDSEDPDILGADRLDCLGRLQGSDISPSQFNTNP